MSYRPDRFCANCRHYNPNKSECRRYPPKLFAFEDNVICDYPTTEPDRACGEFKRDTPREISTVYNRFKHLDPVLSNLGEEDDNIAQAAGEFWRAIKADLGVDGGEQ